MGIFYIFSYRCLYEFLVMAFGLCNAPSTFQRLMKSILRGLNWRTCLIYLDDVIVFSKTFDDHLNHLAEVFERFREANIKLKLSKCMFGQNKVTVKQVRSFLGLADYYRFVKNFAKIASPLHALTKRHKVSIGMITANRHLNT